MATENRTTPDRLIDDLAARPWSFDFFQAVRLLECSRADLPRIGASQHVAEDPVRFCQEPSLAFAPATVWALKPPVTVDRDGLATEPFPPVPRLFVNFIGLLGPNGPLPLHITEYARDRERNSQDPTLARFLDLFNHRVVSLFYRAWATCSKVVNFEQGPATAADRFGVHTASLIGIGMDSLLARDRVEDLAKLFYAGRLAGHTRNAEGLRAVIADYFRVPADIIEFAGQWIDLPDDCLCRLGKSRSTGLLGSTSIVGSRMWDCQQKFRIRLGPLDLRDYERLLPTGTSLGRLVDWVLNYTCDELSWDLQLVLKRSEVPQVRLGGGGGGRLGWTTWLKTAPLDRDPDDLVLRPAAA